LTSGRSGAPARALSATAFVTLLLIALIMGANHVAARIAFNHGTMWRPPWCSAAA
jgi:hypothetical protein